MKLIAHRGNINGPDPENENSPKYIESAIQQGYDVEIDLRVGIGLQLGHDKSQYFIDSSWLNTFKDNLWIHCKDFAALTYLTERRFVDIIISGIRRMITLLLVRDISGLILVKM